MRRRVLALACVGAVLVAMAGAGWLTVFRPAAKARVALEELARRTGLVGQTARESAWPRLRTMGEGTFGRLTLPSARGEREGLRVEVGTVPDLGRGHPAMTWVAIFAAAEIVKGSTGLSREAGQQLAAALRLGSDTRPVHLDWFGEGVTWGSAAEFERAFRSPTTGLLRHFSRPWATILFDGQVLLLQWFGLERDAAVIEEAFRIGVACVQAAPGRAR